MHECPFCGRVCDCDMEDTWLDPPDDCTCSCWLEEDLFDDEDLEDYFWENLESKEVGRIISDCTG